MTTIRTVTRSCVNDWANCDCRLNILIFTANCEAMAEERASVRNDVGVKKQVEKSRREADDDSEDEAYDVFFARHHWGVY